MNFLTCESYVSTREQTTIYESGAELEMSNESITHHSLAKTQMSSSAIHDTLRQRLASSTLRDRQRLHVLLQIQVEVLKDEVQLVAIRMHDIEQTDNVRVVHFL